MKKLIKLLSRQRVSKPESPRLFRSYLAFYNGQLETVTGRYLLRVNESVDR